MLIDGDKMSWLYKFQRSLSSPEASGSALLTLNLEINMSIGFFAKWPNWFHCGTEKIPLRITIENIILSRLGDNVWTFIYFRWLFSIHFKLYHRCNESNLFRDGTIFKDVWTTKEVWTFKIIFFEIQKLFKLF